MSESIDAVLGEAVALSRVSGLKRKGIVRKFHAIPESFPARDSRNNRRVNNS